MEHLKSFEAASEFLSKDPQAVPLITGIDQPEAEALIAIYKLSVISAASWKAEKKEINWDDSDQYKYYGWFDMDASSGSGAGFAFYGCNFGSLVFGCRLPPRFSK